MFFEADWRINERHYSLYTLDDVVFCLGSMVVKEKSLSSLLSNASA